MDKKSAVAGSTDEPSPAICQLLAFPSPTLSLGYSPSNIVERLENGFRGASASEGKAESQSSFFLCLIFFIPTISSLSLPVIPSQPLCQPLVETDVGRSWEKVTRETEG